MQPPIQRLQSAAEAHAGAQVRKGRGLEGLELSLAPDTTARHGVVKHRESRPCCG